MLHFVAFYSGPVWTCTVHFILVLRPYCSTSTVQYPLLPFWCGFLQCGVERSGMVRFGPVWRKILARPVQSGLGKSLGPDTRVHSGPGKSRGPEIPGSPVQNSGLVEGVHPLGSNDRFPMQVMQFSEKYLFCLRSYR